MKLVQSIYTTCYLIWCDLFAFTGVLSLKYFLEIVKSFPWCSPVPLKFQSSNLQHCKRNGHKLVFWVISEQLLYHIIFGQLLCYEGTLVKRHDTTTNPTKDWIKDFWPKRFQKPVCKVKEEKNSCFEIKSYNL